MSHNQDRGGTYDNPYEIRGSSEEPDDNSPQAAANPTSDTTDPTPQATTPTSEPKETAELQAADSAGDTGKPKETAKPRRKSKRHEVPPMHMVLRKPRTNQKPAEQEEPVKPKAARAARALRPRPAPMAKPAPTARPAPRARPAPKSGKKRAQPEESSQDEADTLGLNEQVKKRKRAPAPKLDDTRLMSPDGLPSLPPAVGSVPYQGKGHEFEDAETVLGTYQDWMDDTYPRARFMDAAGMVEKTGHRKTMGDVRNKWIENDETGNTETATHHGFPDGGGSATQHGPSDGHAGNASFRPGGAAAANVPSTSWFSRNCNNGIPAGGVQSQVHNPSHGNGTSTQRSFSDGDGTSTQVGPIDSDAGNATFGPGGAVAPNVPSTCWFGRNYNNGMPAGGVQSQVHNASDGNGTSTQQSFSVGDGTSTQLGPFDGDAGNASFWPGGAVAANVPSTSWFSRNCNNGIPAGGVQSQVRNPTLDTQQLGNTGSLPSSTTTMLAAGYNYPPPQTPGGWMLVATDDEESLDLDSGFPGLPSDVGSGFYSAPPVQAAMGLVAPAGASMGDFAVIQPGLLTREVDPTLPSMGLGTPTPAPAALPALAMMPISSPGRPTEPDMIDISEVDSDGY